MKRDKNLEETAAKILRGELTESIELEEVAGDAPSPQVEKIIDLVKELPTTDIKAFLDELAKVFEQKADEEDSDIYRSVSKHIHNAFSDWFEGALDEL